MPSMKRPVRFYDEIAFNSSNTFQRIDVLRIVSHQQFLPLEHLYKIMTNRRFKTARIQFFRQLEERFWILIEITQLEYRLRVWQVVFL